jgi:hypothetical protein
MTKTQASLLELARKYGGNYSITTCYGRGPKGGRVTGGARERDAMFALEKMGLIVITDRQPWEEYNSGYKQSGNSIAFKLA